MCVSGHLMNLSPTFTLFLSRCALCQRKTPGSRCAVHRKTKLRTTDKAGTCRKDDPILNRFTVFIGWLAGMNKLKQPPPPKKKTHFKTQGQIQKQKGTSGDRINRKQNRTERRKTEQTNWRQTGTHGLNTWGNWEQTHGTDNHRSGKPDQTKKRSEIKWKTHKVKLPSITEQSPNKREITSPTQKTKQNLNISSNNRVPTSFPKSFTGEDNVDARLFAFTRLPLTVSANTDWLEQWYSDPQRLKAKCFL